MRELLSLPLGALDDDPGIRPQVGGAQSRCHFANTTPAAGGLPRSGISSASSGETQRDANSQGSLAE
jgi:hypothetical protein